MLEMILGLAIYAVCWTALYLHGPVPEEVEADWLRKVFVVFMVPLTILFGMVLTLGDLIETFLESRSMSIGTWLIHTKSEWKNFSQDVKDAYEGPEHD